MASSSKAATGQSSNSDEQWMRRQLIGLYRLPIEALLQPEDVEQCKGFFNDSEYRWNFAGKQFGKGERRYLYDTLMKTEAGEKMLLRLLNLRNKAMVNKLLLNDLEKKSIDLYANFFQNSTLISIVMSLELDSVLNELKKDTQSKYDQLVARVQFSRREHNLEEACKVLIRELPYTGQDWYWDFVQSLNVDPENIGLIKHIDANFWKNYEAHKVEQRSLLTSKNGAAIDNQNVTDEESDESDDEPLSNQLKCRNQKDYDNLSGNLRLNRPVEPIELRKYQQELAQYALEGTNTIVCAPTGSGKTIVAAAIIRNHLNQATDDSPRRVAMLVPTVPLVDQQTKKLNVHLVDKYRVQGMAGGEIAGLKAPIVLASHVMVMTPQILLNMLHSGVKADKLRFADFTLFVLDECHHTDEKHPYNVLMQDYHDYEPVGDSNDDSKKQIANKESDPTNGPHGLTGSAVKKPQVIGLTASLGVGSGRTVDSALEFMLTMCAQMDCERLSVVHEHVADLEAWVPRPIDKLEEVSRPRNDPFAIYVENLMAQIEKRLEPKLRDLADRLHILNQSEAKIPQHKSSLEYMGWVCQMHKNKIPKLLDAQLKSEIMTSIDYLKTYHKALDLNAHLPTEQAVVFLLREMQYRAEDQRTQEQMRLVAEFNEKQKFLVDIAKDKESQAKPIVEKLREVLIKKYQENEMARTIIFVKTRQLTIELKDYLNKVPVAEGVCAGNLTSANVSGSNWGQGASEQQQSLADFSAGNLKILVCTTVAEEGLDIAECNLIVKYNHVGSEIAMIQRRGRGRAVNSHSVLIAQDGSIAEQELKNMQKERLMVLCIEHLRNFGPNYFKQQVQRKVESLKENRLIESNRLQMRRVQLGDNTFELQCRVCSAYICTSRDVKRVENSSYVCVNADFWRRTRTDSVKTPRAVGLSTTAGQSKCAHCSNELGPIVKFCGVFLPTLKAEGFLLRQLASRSGKRGAGNNDGKNTKNILENKTAKKWAQIENQFFMVDPITETDKKRMLKALLGLADDDNEFKQQVEMLEKAVLNAETNAMNKARKVAEIEQRELDLRQQSLSEMQ